MLYLSSNRVTVVLAKLVFSPCQRFQNGQRIAIKFCIKLKKTILETSEMLKSACSEECLSRTSAFEWHIFFKEG
jgi:hypothetical protein